MRAWKSSKSSHVKITIVIVMYVVGVNLNFVIDVPNIKFVVFLPFYSKLCLDNGLLEPMEVKELHKPLVVILKRKDQSLFQTGTHLIFASVPLLLDLPLVDLHVLHLLMQIHLPHILFSNLTFYDLHVLPSFL